MKKTLLLVSLLTFSLTACDNPEQIAREKARIAAEKADRITSEDVARLPKFDWHKYRLLKRGGRFFLVPNGWDIGEGIIPYAGDGFVFHWNPKGLDCPNKWDPSTIKAMIPACKPGHSEVMVLMRFPREDWEIKITTTPTEACAFKATQEKIGIPFKWNGLFIGISPYRDSPMPYDKDWQSVCNITLKILNQIVEIK